MKTVIEMAKQAGAIPIHKSPKEVAVVGNEAIERFAELACADERNATLEEIAKWLEDEKDAPYWAELVRARRSNT
jgi:ABC-type enterochelin transport system substrate-binding protein